MTMRRPTSDHSDPAIEVRLRPSAPAASAGAALRAAAESVGIGAERSTRLRVLVEQLVEEARERECAASDEDVVVRIVEHGASLHVEVADHRLPVTPAEARRARSRRMVALGFADRLHLANHGVDGNVAEVEVGAAGDDRSLSHLEGTQVLGDHPPRASDEEAAALEIRPMVPADAEGLARCVYRCYGYTYLDPLMYRPDHVRRALRSGLMRSIVAVTPGGEVVGHIAMTFERGDDPVPEGGKLVVDPRYRGHHVAERLAAERRRLAGELGLPGVWAECVTNHVFSQREVLGSGGGEVGFLIGATPASITMADLEDEAVGRHSLLAMFVPLADEPPDEPAVVHVRPHVAELVADMAVRLGLERGIDATGTGAAPASAATTLSTSVSGEAGTAHVRLGSVGEDLLDRLDAELDGLASFDLAAVHLDVPAWEPSGAWAQEQAARLGFFFGAWLPSFAPGGDVVRMQRIGSHPVDVAHAQCARSEGEAVRDAVVEDWRRVRTGALTDN